MRRKSGNTFKYVYFIILGVLIVLAIAALMYVRHLLKDYEAAQPEACAEEVFSELKAESEAGKLWSYMIFPDGVTVGKYEEGLDMKKSYADLFSADDIEITQKAGAHAEDELVYNVKSGGFTFAEITLRALSEPVTRLAVFTSREWTLKHVEPVIESHKYTLSVPDGFTVALNGVPLTAADAVESSDGGLDYTVDGIYLKPNFVISDSEGNVAKYTLKGSRVIPILFNYSLTLPSTLSVELNGQAHPGDVLESGLVRYDIRLINKPEVKISDLFGNSVGYEGGNELPLTYMVITANDGASVLVNGAAVPETAVSRTDNPDFSTFAQYDPTLPKLSVYNIAILKDDAVIDVTDSRGNKVDVDPTKHSLDITGLTSGTDVPAEIASQIDVLTVAENWSLFMSNDLPFYRLTDYLIPASYQYEVATKYANGIDITFTSIHTLDNPPFTGESVGNYVRITDNCFSVDIKFDKQMTLSDGKHITDSMNDRFYFVKYAETGTWKLVCMKEIVK